MDHDRLFKELLTTFFSDFIELFLPKVAAYLDRESIEFIDKEVFTDINAGPRHVVDLLAKAKVEGQRASFLIHVETQATAVKDFPKRMFHYYARLHLRHQLPVYPIALFSYDVPHRTEPDLYQVAFPDLDVLKFQYRVIQLNRLDWRDFVRTPNPVASALMAKMRIAPEDRPRVKLECLRLLSSLELEPARMQMIWGFVESYLKLTPREEAAMRLKSRRPKLDMEFIRSLPNSFRDEGRREGKSQGLKEGREETVLDLLSVRFRRVPQAIRARIHSLTEPQLQAMARAMFDFEDLAQVETWLSRRR